MKIFILQLVFLIIIICGCSSSDNSVATNNANPCGNITDFTVFQQNENITFNLVSSATPLFYEVSIVSSTNSLDPNNGHIQTINNINQSFTIASLGMITGSTYVFFIRTACNDGTKSEWSTAKSLTISSFCAMPYNIAINGHDLIWSSSNIGVSQFQIEYGAHDFVLGTGTTTQVNTTVYPFVAMQENMVYDFYVRSYCNASLGWSLWSGPYSYLCPINYNDCNAPSNVGYSVSYNFFNQATGASISWNFNGESNFEYTIVGAGLPVTAGTINNCGQNPSIYIGLPQNTNYHFYVRAICANGNRTNWVGPKLINIGT